MEESWTISPSCDQVRIYSTNFNTELNYDWLTLTESGATEGERESGEGLCVEYVMATPVSVQFTSDGSETRAGFRLNYICTDAPAGDG